MVDTFYPHDQMEDAQEYFLRAEHIYQRLMREPVTEVPGTITFGNVHTHGINGDGTMGMRPTTVLIDDIEVTGVYGNAGAHTEQQMQNFREQLDERARQTIDQQLTNAITQGTATMQTTAEGNTTLTYQDLYDTRNALTQGNTPEWRAVDTYATTDFNRDQMMMPLDNETNIIIAGDDVDIDLLETLYVAYREAEAIEKIEPRFSCNEYRDKAEWLRLYFEIANITGDPNQKLKHNQVDFCSIDASQYAAYLKNGEAIFLTDNFKYIATFLKGTENASFSGKPNKRDYKGMMLGIEAMALWLADYYTKEEDAEQGKETREMDNRESTT